MKIILGIYILQTILGYFFWVKILGSKPITFIQIFTYICFSLILIPNLMALIAFCWGRYDKFKKERVLKCKNPCKNKK